MLHIICSQASNSSLLNCGSVCRSFSRAVWQCGHCKIHCVILCVISPTFMTTLTVTYFDLSLGKLRPLEWTGQSWAKKKSLLFLSSLPGSSWGCGGDWSLILASFSPTFVTIFWPSASLHSAFPSSVNMISHSCQHASR